MRCLVLLIVVISFLFPPLHAQEFALTDKDKEDIRNIEEYLNGITTMTSNFTQTSAHTLDKAGGNYSFGKFFLSRPGKIRWEYTLPDPVILIVDGEDLTYYDKELDQISYSKVDSTLTTLLAREKISLDPSLVDIVSLRREKTGFTITIKEKDKEEEQLTMTFSYAPTFTLKQIAVRDTSGKLTSVQLDQHMYGIELNNDLFNIKNPRIFDEKNKR